MRPRATAGALLAVAALAGCAADRPVHVSIRPGVIRPERAAVVFFVDGFGRRAFDAALRRGDLPQLRTHILDRGVTVRRAVAAIPTITYANSVTFLTGQVPGHHGINSNRWFDPTTGAFRDYTTIGTYRRVDEDYTSLTIHDLLTTEDSYSVQAAQRRGCDYTIDNIITAGINWGFRNYCGVDCLVAQNMSEVADRANRRGRWPSFIYFYLPGVDHEGHLHGTQSADYRHAIRNLDRQIGRICDALRDAGMYDRTNLALVADHGMVDIHADHVIDPGVILRTNSGRAVASVGALRRRGHSPERYDAIWSAGGTRHCAVHIRDGNDWRRRYVAPDGASPTLAPFVSGRGGNLFDHPGIAVATGRHAANAVWLHNARGVARVERRGAGPAAEYRYDPARGDVLNYLADPARAAFVRAGWHGSRDWLRQTADSDFPDLVPQIVELFDSPRAGDIVFFAASDWDFGREEPAAGHGSVLPDDIDVPMAFAGPGVRAGAVVDVARNCDLMPTVLDMLGIRDRLHNPPPIDGVSLWPLLSSAPESLPAPAEETIRVE
ncbi:MAG: alkaline phosphatase family protein [Phycisphaerae bacterium]